MATAKEIITKAKTFIGVKESPRNSNNVIFNTDYYGHAVSGSAYPWCCAFVWDIFRMCKASKLFYNGEKTAYCPAVLQWGKKEKLTVAKSRGRMGDLVLFDWDKDGVADHIGFVLSRHEDGTYTTIEGNTSVGNNSNGGEVMERHRYTKDIIAIIRPKYAIAKAKPKKQTITPKAKENTAKTENKALYKVTAWKGLRLRTGAGYGYKIKAVMPRDSKVTKLSTKGEWCRVKYESKTGYCYSKYLKKVK